jgi:hypothetical protein
VLKRVLVAVERRGWLVGEIALDGLGLGVLVAAVLAWGRLLFT